MFVSGYINSGFSRNSHNLFLVHRVMPKTTMSGFKPTINLDKLWTLVPEEARKASTAAKAVVIDVTKNVSQTIK